ncbi:MAG: hypothetical protein VX656_17840 [Candidatus Latescibacterota bacterium]|nr:hypothetical protein [Candidatus Latescibacterota bacterium]
MTVRILPRALTAVRRGVEAGVMGLAFGAQAAQPYEPVHPDPFWRHSGGGPSIS